MLQRCQRRRVARKKFRAALEKALQRKKATDAQRKALKQLRAKELEYQRLQDAYELGGARKVLEISRADEASAAKRLQDAWRSRAARQDARAVKRRLAEERAATKVQRVFRQKDPWRCRPKRYEDRMALVPKPEELPQFEDKVRARIDELRGLSTAALCERARGFAGGFDRTLTAPDTALEADLKENAAQAYVEFLHNMGSQRAVANDCQVLAAKASDHLEALKRMTSLHHKPQFAADRSAALVQRAARAHKEKLRDGAVVDAVDDADDADLLAYERQLDQFY